MDTMRHGMDIDPSRARLSAKLTPAAHTSNAAHFHRYDHPVLSRCCSRSLMKAWLSSILYEVRSGSNLLPVGAGDYFICPFFMRLSREYITLIITYCS